MIKEELKRQAAALVEANPAHICALCIPLGEEPLFDLGGKTRVVSASTIKTPILCTALEQVTFPAGLRTIGAASFWNCQSLRAARLRVREVILFHPIKPRLHA